MFSLAASTVLRRFHSWTLTSKLELYCDRMVDYVDFHWKSGVYSAGN